jgi:hypothetical protein
MIRLTLVVPNYHINIKSKHQNLEIKMTQEAQNYYNSLMMFCLIVKVLLNKTQ